MIDLTNPAVPETGHDWNITSSGASFGSVVQTNAAHTNVGTVGQPTPGGSVELTNANACAPLPSSYRRRDPEATVLHQDRARATRCLVASSLDVPTYCPVRSSRRISLRS